jgi:hypothetical protein
MVRLLGSDSWRYAKSVREDRFVDSVGDVVEAGVSHRAALAPASAPAKERMVRDDMSGKPSV